MLDWNGIRRIFGVYEEIYYGELIPFNIAFRIFKSARIFLYDEQVLVLTYEILGATGWQETAPPHKLLGIAREMSKISRLLPLWITRSSMKVIEIVKDKLGPVVLRINIYIRNQTDQLVKVIKSIKKERSRIEDAESQLKAPGSSNMDDPQALIRQAEIAFNTLIESAQQDIFKGSNRFAKNLAEYFQRWKAREYALIGVAFSCNVVLIFYSVLAE